MKTQVLKTWQAVLEEFARTTEPMTWELEHVRVPADEKYEAVLYLLEKGLIAQAGRVRDEHCDNLYVATEAGRFMWRVGFTELRRRKRPTGRREQDCDPTLAQRTVAIAHRDVFDLIRLPWTYSMRAEQLREFGEAA